MCSHCCQQGLCSYYVEPMNWLHLLLASMPGSSLSQSSVITNWLASLSLACDGHSLACTLTQHSSPLCILALFWSNDDRAWGKKGAESLINELL